MGVNDEGAGETSPRIWVGDANTIAPPQELCCNSPTDSVLDRMSNIKSSATS